VPPSRRGRLEPSEADILGALDRALGCIIEATRAHEGRLLVTGASGREPIFALVRAGGSKSSVLWRPPWDRVVDRGMQRLSHASPGDDASEGVTFLGRVDVDAGSRDGCHITAPLFEGIESLGVIEVFQKKNGVRFSRGDHDNLSVLAHLFSPILLQLRDHRFEKLAR
jgi:hypothetical protein